MITWLMSYFGRGVLEYWLAESKYQCPIKFKIEIFERTVYRIFVPEIPVRIIDSSCVTRIYFRGRWRKPVKILAQYGQTGNLSSMKVWLTD